MIWIAVGLATWYLIGAIVLSAIDDEDLSLLHWAERFPLLADRPTPGIGVIVVCMAWPLVVWKEKYHG